MEKILIVEDDFIVRDNLEKLLNEEGYNAKSAEDGLEALNILQTDLPDLIISDIMMPNVDGYEFLQDLRATSRTELLPVIFLSAKSDRASMRTGMDLGADDYISKPFSADELLTAIGVRLKKHKNYERIIDDMKENICKYVPHELRTPLVSILGYSDLLLEDLESLSTVEFKEMVTRIKKSGMRLSEWIEKFIFYTEVKLNNNLFKSNPMNGLEVCEINEKIWEDNYFNNRAWIDRVSDIVINVEEERLKIKRANLEFIILELVENAAKFSKPGTQINIEGVKTDSHYKLTFSDYGIGFEKEEIEKVAAFKQFHRNNLQQNGNGLGLTIVNNILQMYKGEMKIQSMKHKDTVIAIHIPLAEEKYSMVNDNTK